MKNNVQALKHPSTDENCFQNVMPIIEDQW